MKTKQLKHHINNTSDSAKYLIDSVDKSLLRKFDKACNEIDKVMHAIKEHYPDACLLVSSNKIDLYIGDRDMGDFTYEGYSRYSVTMNKEFIASSNVIESLEIEV